jgi:hypothetical protein
MKITLFLSHCCAIKSEQWSFRVFYLSTRWDWFRSSTRLRFYHLACLEFSVRLFSLCDFFYVLFRPRSAVPHLPAVAPIIAGPLPHTTPFQCFVLDLRTILCLLYDDVFSLSKNFLLSLRIAAITSKFDFALSNFQLSNYHKLDL